MQTDFSMASEVANNSIETNPYLISQEDRISYYLNHQEVFEISYSQFQEVKERNFWNNKELHLISFKQFKNTLAHWYCKNLIRRPFFKEIRALPFYSDYRNLHSLMNFFEPFDKLEMSTKDAQYPVFYGEMGDTSPISCIRKSRTTEDMRSIIYNFRSIRHTDPCFEVRRKDIPWAAKNNDVIWRGATTGKEHREKFVQKYFDQYDVAFSTVKQKPNLAPYKKDRVSIAKQLTYKYIVSLEGNELPSNRRWTLASNSVPIMPKPKWHSWIMEEKLEPYVHYLELNDDLSNLEELLNWARENDEKCREIALNGKQFMAQFLDLENDLKVQKLLLEEFSKRTTYIN